MIAEDDDDARELLAERFTAANYEVFAAADGAAAMALLEQVRSPTAIFLDIVMPGVLGTSVLKYIQSDARLATVPLAIVTASADLAPAGVMLFRKPVRFEELLAFVEQRDRHEIVLRLEPHTK